MIGVCVVENGENVTPTSPQETRRMPGLRLLAVSKHFKEFPSIWGLLGIVFVVGIALGLNFEPPSVDPPPWNIISSIVGWIYFMSWSISFLPQIYLNYCRKSVVGESFNLVAFNSLGFPCLTIYTITFYFVPSVRLEYARRFGSENTVDLNDVGFAISGWLWSWYNLYQIYVYDCAGQRFSRVVLVGIGIVSAVSVGWCSLLALNVQLGWFDILSFLYWLSLIKISGTLVKYIPQIHLNYQRKRTVGWSIETTILDFTGGLLSVTQQLIDCASTGRWNGIVGNIVKIALGVGSMSYDCILMSQHFYVYRSNNLSAFSEEQELKPLDPLGKKDIGKAYGSIHS